MGRRAAARPTPRCASRGMVGAKGKIGVLDTVLGRARLYSAKVPGGFVVGELTPPYTPRRYLEAIEEFLAYGVDIPWSIPFRIVGKARAASWRWPTRPRSMARKG